MGMNNKILYALIATIFVVGLFTAAYAGITLPMINLAGDVTILGQMTCSSCVNTADIAPNAVVASKIADGAVVGGTGGDIADNTITAADIAANAVGSSEIATNAVGASEINPNEVQSRIIIKTLVDSSSTGCKNGWCPDGILDQFGIDDVAINAGSIVIVNLINANIGVPPVEEICNVTEVREDKVIIGCNVAPRDAVGGGNTINLRYAIVN